MEVCGKGKAHKVREGRTRVHSHLSASELGTDRSDLCGRAIHTKKHHAVHAVGAKAFTLQ